MPPLTIKGRWPYPLRMADEKKEPGLSDLIKEILKTRPHAGTDLLLGKPSGDRTPEQEALWALFESAAKVDAQKRAAETGEVDNVLANKWFVDHWPQPRTCPVCKQNDWGLNPVFGHVSIGALGAQLRTRTVPMVMVTCRICGHTLFFNAVLMGLLQEGTE